MAFRGLHNAFANRNHLCKLRDQPAGTQKTPILAMKLIIYPPVEEFRLERIREAAGAMHIVNAVDEKSAVAEMPDADALFGKITPALLATATKLRWVQSATASLEHYM